MFRPHRPQKIYTYFKQIVPVGSDIGRGRSSTLGVISTLGRIWPGLRRRHGRKDLHLKGGSQHCTWALDGRVKPRDCGEGPPNAVVQRPAESVAHMAAQGPQMTLGGATQGDAIEAKGLTESQDGLGHGHALGLLPLSRLGKQFLTDSSRVVSYPADNRTTFFRRKEKNGDKNKVSKQGKHSFSLDSLAWADQADPTATARPSTRVPARAVTSGFGKGEHPLRRNFPRKSFFHQNNFRASRLCQ
jgi:hypothetical protein